MSDVQVAERIKELHDEGAWIEPRSFADHGGKLHFLPVALDEDCTTYLCGRDEGKEGYIVDDPAEEDRCIKCSRILEKPCIRPSRRKKDVKSSLRSYRIMILDLPNTYGWDLRCEQLFGERDNLQHRFERLADMSEALQGWISKMVHTSRPKEARHRPLCWANTEFRNQSLSVHYLDLESYLNAIEDPGAAEVLDDVQEPILCPACDGVGRLSRKVKGVNGKFTMEDALKCPICDGEGSTVTLVPWLKATRPGAKLQESNMNPLEKQPGTMSRQDLRVLWLLVETELKYEEIAATMGLSGRNSVWKMAKKLLAGGWLIIEDPGGNGKRPSFRYPEDLQLLVDNEPAEGAPWHRGSTDDDEEEEDIHRFQVPAARYGRRVDIPFVTSKYGGWT